MSNTTVLSIGPTKAAKAPTHEEASGFRKDINGLRAVAVIAVVLFHFDIAPISGGFVGVDVFFVISGFLMTSIIAGAARAGRFRVIDFYLSRTKRILPALIVVVLVSLALASRLLLPETLMTAAREAFQAVAFSINFHFADTSDYFAPRVDQSWFLHCWSLAVEIQFYLMVPFIILASLRASPKQGLLIGLILCFVVSFLASWIETKSNSQHAFYLPFYRVWEFAAGGIVSELPLLQKWRRPTAWAGIVLIVGSCVLYSSALLYPGIWPLAPVVGAALVIWARSEIVVLTNRVSQFLGTTSYSIYLWHWPVLMAGKTLFRNADVATVAAEFLAILVLSYLSYRLVEAPFRKAWGRANLNPIMAAAIALLLVSVWSRQIVENGGFPERIPEDIRELTATAVYGNSWRGQKCFLGPEQRFSDFAPECFADPKDPRPVILLMGDSTVAQYYPGLMAQPWIAKFDVEEITASACGFYGQTPPGGRPFCPEIQKRSLDLALAQRPAVVMLSVAQENLLGEDKSAPNYGEHLAWLVRRLSAGGIGKVIVVGQPPAWEAPLPDVYVRESVWRQGLPKTIEPAGMRNILAWDKTMQAKTKEAGGIYVPLVNTLCPDSQCLVLIPTGKGPVLAQFDSLHFTDLGSAYVVQKVIGPAIEAR